MPTLMRTVWVFGDQVNTSIGALADVAPTTHRVLLIESRAKLDGRRWHRQRAHFLIASMRRFAHELRAAGFVVDYRSSDTFTDGFRAHVKQFSRLCCVESELGAAGRTAVGTAFR